MAQEQEREKVRVVSRAAFDAKFRETRPIWVVPVGYGDNVLACGIFNMLRRNLPGRPVRMTIDFGSSPESAAVTVWLTPDEGSEFKFSNPPELIHATVGPREQKSPLELLDWPIDALGRG